MQTLFPNHLLRRPAHTTLDNTSIRVGDIVHLQPVDGPAIRARVIYNTPINGTTSYTTDIVMADNKAIRARFRHEHVHAVEPLRAAA